MKNIFIFLLIMSKAFANIVPVQQPEMLVQDELFPYLWGLHNQGQTLLQEKDDIHNVPLLGKPGSDVGWGEFIKKMPLKRPVIAVLDSGVDLDHPELQGNLWKNEKECGQDLSKDNDGNNLKGDCHGWNFTQAIDSEMAKDLTDTDGHGTHIAGIIAALSNNFGIVGVLPEALIMPIKVMGESNSASSMPSSESFARGIIYAVDNGADVINMSLGWPKSLETKALRDAVSYALSRGVPIVAAAGNNNSSAPLYPCAYDGVICVGALTIDGSIASFSNFGGHVDVLAPGESILGLHPYLFVPDYFPIIGFEIRSGTSQATPYAAALIGALKAFEPSISIDDIFARLYSLPQLQNDKKNILGGVLHWGHFQESIKHPVIRPVFKKLRQLIVKGSPLEGKLPVMIRNFGSESGPVEVSVESLSSGVLIPLESRSLNGMKKGEFKEFEFPLKVLNQNGESTLSYRVKIQSQEGIKSFIQEVPIMRDIKGEESYRRSDFIFKNKPLSLGIMKEGTLTPLISTIKSYGASRSHEFYSRKILKEEKRIEITVFQENAGKFVEVENMIVIENGLKLVNFLRADLNHDLIDDYLVQSLVERDNKKFFIYSFYDKNLNSLWPEFQHVMLDLHFDFFVENLNDIYLLDFDHPQLGKIKVPSYFTRGAIPKADQILTSWDRPDLSKKMLLYYLVPTDNTFILKVLNTKVFEEKVKTELHLKWYETVEAEQILPVSVDDIKLGRVRLLISVGFGMKRQIYIFSFHTNLHLRGPQISQLVLQSNEVDQLYSITSEGLIGIGEIFFNIYDRSRAKIIATQVDSQTSEYIFKSEDPFDVIAGHIASFDLLENRLSIIQTREELVTTIYGKMNKTTYRPKLRYSFLSQKLLSEMYFPVTYGRDGVQRPALYVDGTSVNGNRVSLLEEQFGELVSSIKNSLLVPQGCRALNPVFSSNRETYKFVFLCFEEKEFVIRTYPMN
jgi:cell wall-associated protease